MAPKFATNISIFRSKLPQNQTLLAYLNGSGGSLRDAISQSDLGRKFLLLC